MGHSFDVSRAHRQHRLAGFQRLHLALLIDARHDRMVRRIQVQTGGIANLLDTECVVGELEAARAVRLNAEQLEVAMHGGLLALAVSPEGLELFSLAVPERDAMDLSTTGTHEHASAGRYPIRSPSYQKGYFGTQH